MNVKPLNSEAYIGCVVRIYRNLHNGLMSVQGKVNGNWKVIGHTANLSLQDVTFKVSLKARERVLRSGKKEVHAFIVGVVSTPLLLTDDFQPIKYNPKKADCFHLLDGSKITQAKACIITDCKPQISL